MTVAELFYALINKYPFYMANPRLLYNGLGHNLTGCEALIKADRQWGDQASSRYWTIKPGFEPCFKTGYYVKTSSKAGAKARKAAAIADIEVSNPINTVSASAPNVDGHSGVSPNSKPTVITYSVKPEISRRPALNKSDSSPAIAASQNALELTGLSESTRQPLKNKINSSNRVSKATSTPVIDVDEYKKKKPGPKPRNAKKVVAVNAKNLKPYPHCVTFPTTHGGMVFPTSTTNFGVNFPAHPFMLQYSASENYVPATRPMPLDHSAVDSTIIPNNTSRLSSLSRLEISPKHAEDARNSHISESSASDSDMATPGDSSLASAMDFTLVRRRSQEELAAMQQQR